MLKKLKVIIPCVLLCLFAVIRFFGAFPLIDNMIYDYVLSHEGTPSKNILIIAMDERSINEIGKWPWPRFYMADAIEKLIEMDVAAIGANVQYDVYGADEDSDNRLCEVAAKSDKLVLASAAILDETVKETLSAEDHILPFPELAAASKHGFINVYMDEDGVLRHALTKMKYGDTTITSLPYEVYLTYCESMGITPRDDIEFDENGCFPINYVGDSGKFSVLSLWGLINDEYNPEIFKNSIALIGPYAQGIGDTSFSTPFDHRGATYGIDVYANVVQNLIDGSIKKEVGWAIDVAILVVLGVLQMILLYRMKPPVAAVVTAILMALQLGIVIVAYMAFDLILYGATAIVFFLLCYVVNLILSILIAQNERQQIQNLFGRFVSPDVVKEIINAGDGVELGGAEKEVSILFVDIRGFTAFSEANPPDKVVSMVNRYLSLTSESIQQFGGTIDKYIGDATMAVFNAPLDLPNHALCAVKSAWAMKVGSAALREEILRDYGVDLQFGIGVNTGVAVIGNMGSAVRMDYTAIGDTVNTSARLEANAQKGQILLSDATYQLVKDHVEVTDLGILNVKNKKIGIQIYNLDGVKEFP